MRIFYTISLVLFCVFSAQSQERNPSFSNGTPSARIIKFYPNPAISYINFEFQKSYQKNLTFQIVNFLGKKIFEINNVTPRTMVELSTFYRGVYIFQLRDASGKVIESGKFQVSR